MKRNLAQLVERRPLLVCIVGTLAVAVLLFCLLSAAYTAGLARGAAIEQRDRLELAVLRAEIALDAIRLLEIDGALSLMEGGADDATAWTASEAEHLTELLRAEGLMAAARVLLAEFIEKEIPND